MRKQEKVLAAVLRGVILLIPNTLYLGVVPDMGLAMALRITTSVMQENSTQKKMKRHQ